MGRVVVGDCEIKITACFYLVRLQSGFYTCLCLISETKRGWAKGWRGDYAGIFLEIDQDEQG